MSCSGRESELYFEAAAEVDCGRKHTMSPGETAKHQVQVKYDGPGTRLVTITSRCSGPLLSFDNGVLEFPLAAEIEVVPALKSADAFPFSTDISCSDPCNGVCLPTREVVSVEVSSTNPLRRFQGRLNPIRLTIKLVQDRRDVSMIPSPRNAPGVVTEA